MNLDEIEARANAATPGPWRDQHHECSEVWGPAPDSQTHSMQIARIGRAQFDVLNAAFIAAARTDVPTLIARVRELEAECDALRALLVDAHRELATIEAITVSPSGVDGLIELVNRIGQKLESSK